MDDVGARAEGRGQAERDRARSPRPAQRARSLRRPGDFAAVWASEDPDEINRRDQVERPYERIVNDLQEILDLCEAEGTDRGVHPPTADPGGEPGRWRRAALRGYLSHAQAERWQAIAHGRQRLAHHYADLPAQRGAEIYERAVELLAELPRAITGIGRWIEKLWPPRES
jgi:hypothetical protein